jgi:hypothetical protein
MKTYKLFSSIFICCLISAASIAQTTKTETIKVSGNCGMCKTKIEKAAKTAGASFADWNVDTKVLTVKYNSKSTNPAKIQKAIAGTGYDTQDVKTTEEAYSKLHACCKYERASSDNAKMDCCKDGKCTMEGHDGKDCCKMSGDAKMDCCKDGKCTMAGQEGKDCCKDGKCTKEGADGKDCCKKS